MRSIETQLAILDNIRSSGAIVMIKLDGERTNEVITVLIDFPRPTEKKAIRLNGDNLNTLLESLIAEYEKLYGK